MYFCYFYKEQLKLNSTQSNMSILIDILYVSSTLFILTLSRYAYGSSITLTIFIPGPCCVKHMTMALLNPLCNSSEIVITINSYVIP